MIFDPRNWDNDDKPFLVLCLFVFAILFMLFLFNLAVLVSGQWDVVYGAAG